MSFMEFLEPNMREVEQHWDTKDLALFQGIYMAAKRNLNAIHAEHAMLTVIMNVYPGKFGVTKKAMKEYHRV